MKTSNMPIYLGGGPTGSHLHQLLEAEKYLHKK